MCVNFHGEIQLVTYGYFLCIVWKKLAKDTKRTKAHIAKSGNTA